MVSATNTGGFIHALPVLDGKNYDQWVVRMEAILDFHEIIGIVKEGISQKEKDDATIMKKDFKAKCLLHQCVDLVVFEKIAKASTAKEAWKILQKAFRNTRKTKKVKLQSLRRQYELLSMSDQETVVDYFNRMQLLVNSMKTYGESLSDQMIVEKILRTLSPQFDHIVVATEELKDLEKLKIEELQNSLEAHEQRLIERENSGDLDQAMQAQFTKNDGNKKKWKKGKGSGKGNWFSNKEKDKIGDKPESSNKGGGGNFSNQKGKKGQDKRKI